MSASEKLKALEETLRVLDPGGGTEHAAFREAEEAAVTFRRALPQIVAVIEAAEDTEYATDPEWPLYGALAELEKAL